MIYSKKRFLTKITQKYRDKSSDFEYLAISAYKSDTRLWIPNEFRSDKFESHNNKYKQSIKLKKLAYYQKTLRAMHRRLLNHSHEIKYVPYDLLTVELVHFVIKQGNLMFSKIPKHMKITEAALECVKRNPYGIKFIPHKFQTQEIVNSAIKDLTKRGNGSDTVARSSGIMIHVANRFKTSENSLMAIKSCHSDIKFIPSNLITREIADIIVRHGEYIDKLPKRLVNHTLLIETLAIHPWNLKYTPHDLKTTETCSLALRNNCDVLDCIPKGLKIKIPRTICKRCERSKRNRYKICKLWKY